MKAISVINQKGGVGKSTTAHAVGAGLSLRGFHVLYVDLDAQGNLSYSLGAGTEGITVMDILRNHAPVQEAIRKVELGDVIPSSPALAAADTILTATGKEYLLKEALEPLRGEYDFCIIDTPPALGILTVNALTACNGAIIPAQADIFSLQGVSQLYSTIGTVRKYCNPSLEILGIVLTRYNSRAILAREVGEMIEETAARFQTKLYQAKIRECTAIKEAQAMRKSIFAYAPRSNAAADYAALVDEIVGKEDKKSWHRKRVSRLS